MADKYSTIQQHQPLRVPQGWDKQEKALVVQLDEIFDDIYRRFGRLRMEDMGKAFRKQIEDDEGNIAQLVVDVGQIVIEVGNKYDIVSGITINTNGIALSGSKYIDIASGCYIDIKSGGTIDIESGGDLNIKSGGNLEVKSGGTFKIASGGNIDMKASGTLELTGSTVLIKSGSTFDVQSTNFTINSHDKYVKTGSWTLYSNGLKREYTDANTGRDSAIAFGKYGLIYLEDSDTVGVACGHSVNSGGGLPYGIIYLMSKYPGGKQARVEIVLNYDTNAGSINAKKADQDSGVSDLRMVLGSSSNPWDYYARTITGGIIYYDSLIQNSSKEVKHDIQPLDNVGDKIDRLQPVTFVYDKDENEQTRMGLIYEDTIEVMPEICTGDEANKAISYTELIPALLKEIQSLRSRVAALEGGQ